MELFGGTAAAESCISGLGWATGAGLGVSAVGEQEGVWVESVVLGDCRPPGWHFALTQLVSFCSGRLEAFSGYCGFLSLAGWWKVLTPTFGSGWWAVSGDPALTWVGLWMGLGRGWRGLSWDCCLLEGQTLEVWVSALQRCPGGAGDLCPAEAVGPLGGGAWVHSGWGAHPGRLQSLEGVGPLWAHGVAAPPSGLQEQSQALSQSKGSF